MIHNLLHLPMKWISGLGRLVAAKVTKDTSGRPEARGQGSGVSRPPDIFPNAGGERETHENFFSNPIARWEGEIRRCFSCHQEFTIELARIVWAAKKSLRRGQWSKLWQGRMPFAKRKGQMLAAQQFSL